MHITGIDIDIDISHPSRCAVLKAVSTIRQYIDDWNNLTACNQEAPLGSFNRQLYLDETNGMKITVTTNFFRRAQIYGLSKL